MNIPDAAYAAAIAVMPRRFNDNNDRHQCCEAVVDAAAPPIIAAVLDDLVEKVEHLHEEKHFYGSGMDRTGCDLLEQVVAIIKKSRNELPEQDRSF